MNISIAWEPQRQRFGVYITGRRKDNQSFKALPVEFTEVKERFEDIEPCIIIENKTDLQNLMDDLWSMGLRPSARSDEYKAQLGSILDHLNDMRALVFKDKRADIGERK